MMGKNKKLNIQGIIPLFMLTIFAACILSVLFTGAGIYSRIAERNTASFNREIYSGYLSNKLNSTLYSRIEICDFEGKEGLMLCSTIESEDYITCIYCNGKFIYELFAPAGNYTSALPGQKIIEAASMKPEIRDGVLYVETKSLKGESVKLFYSLNGLEADYEK